MKSHILFVSLMLAFNTSSAFAEDLRQKIWVSAAEKTALLGEMRLFLQASQQVLEATLENDMEKVETLAREVGVKMMKATPPALSAKLPKAFVEIGPQTHLGFEDIADEASGLGDSQVVLKRLAQLQLSCIQCHAQFQFSVKPE